MAPPIYFLRGLQSAGLLAEGKVVRSTLESRGLAIPWRDVQADEIAVQQTNNGPDKNLEFGASGLIVSARSKTGGLSPRFGHAPSSLAWTQVSETVFLGIDPDSRPGPDDLARREQIDGYPVELAGQKYLLPIIRRRDGWTALPRDWVYTVDGEPTSELKPEFRGLWEAGAKAGAYCVGEIGMTDAEQLAFCVRALGVNYRFGPFEQTALRLVDSLNAVALMGATADYAFLLAELEEIGKKNGGQIRVGGSCLTRGEPAGSPVIARHGASSI